MGNFKRLVLYMKPYWWRIVIAGIASTAYGAMDASFAFFIEPVLKNIFITKDITFLKLIPLALLAIFFARGICRFLNDYFMRTAGQLAIQDVRNEVFQKNINLSLSFFGKNQIGSLMSRVMNDVYSMQEGMGNVISGILRDGVNIIGLLFVIFYRDWQLSLITLVVIPATIFPAKKIGGKIKKMSHLGQEKAGDLTSYLQETYLGIKVIKAFGLEKRTVAAFMEKNKNFYWCAQKAIKYNAISSPVIEVITSIGISTVVLVGGNKVINGHITAAEFFSFITAMALFYSPLKKLTSAYNDAQRCLGSAARVFEIIDEKSEIQYNNNALTIDKAEGIVSFENVSFKYSDKYVLKNINLTALKGSIIALVGTSGAGKTTLVSLIPRFYDVTEGQVSIDSINVKNISHESLMKQIALVDQETILFNDTIANNIRYGNPEATNDDVIKAARQAYAHEFIEEMPEGYETSIGDRGLRLSGGQRQRICIARALLKNSPILILDEATSALDTESEHMVQAALSNLMKERTTFVIAHRLSTILEADNILVMENGQIVEEGKHMELLSHDGSYKRFYEMQFKNAGELN